MNSFFVKENSMKLNSHCLNLYYCKTISYGLSAVTLPEFPSPSTALINIPKTKIQSMPPKFFNSIS